jgi:outer membrane protein assembly factor BamB
MRAAIPTFDTGSGVVFSSPAIGQDGTVYICSTDNNFYAVNPAAGAWRLRQAQNRPPK